MTVIKDKKSIEQFKRLLPYISVYKLAIGGAIVALAINALSDIYMLSLLKPILDEGFGDLESNYLQILPFIILGTALLRGCSGFVYGYLLSWVSSNIVMKLRRELFNHLMKMPVSYFSKESTGTLLSKITYDTEQVAGATSSTLITLVREIVTIFGLLALMFWTSWQLSSVLLIVCPVIGILISVISKRLKKVSHNIQNEMGNLATSSEQMLKGHKEVLSFGGQKKEVSRFEGVTNQVRQQNMKLIVAQQVSSPVIQTIASFALVAVLYIASMDNIHDQLSAGTFTVVFASMYSLLRPLRGLTNVLSEFQRGMAACESLFEILDKPTESNTGKHTQDSTEGNVRFDGVSFGYEGASGKALDNISIDIPTNKMTAIVGRSGSGKSTLVQLLPRLYSVDSGSVLLDGVNVEDYELSNLRTHISSVSQDIHLFSDSIANNIAYPALENAKRSEIENAAKLANAHEFIVQLPEGYDTEIGQNGVTLSGGQRQRLAIARALLKKSKVLILDEATSALDTESERAIQEALANIQKEKTLVVIAHRLSTIEHADNIIVVEQGRVSGQGTHQELLNSDPVYSKLYQSLKSKEQEAQA
ncbi:lipid A export permease/ATP-binding protein MsbA [Vibrio sp. vnigr-6D03]|uniref:lipid A export permease/ATP-binding protein MsbA n=1 Tax=Vibrio sp. vnigr-6D03 TaxID=2058088 RepID=UPI000C334110|nr:lipid A export permease/ATP-binding protein MsbA [Vibrio sp. vnigr-6D03]PKF78301.1 lipid A export permease/ATP-binding protein MsbA [Vibrio sp. vnigr-6D03]